MDQVEEESVVVNNFDDLNARAMEASVTMGTSEKTKADDVHGLLYESTGAPYDGSDDDAVKQYEKDSQGEESTRLRKMKNVVNSVVEYHKDKKNEAYKNLNFATESKVKDYDEKTLKKVKGNIDDAKKKMAMFEKTNDIFKRYMKWSLFICLICPFAIPAMLSLIVVLGGGMATHEVICQRIYRHAVKDLGSEYTNKHYSKGMKDAEKLTNTYTPSDMRKQLEENLKNAKTPEDKAKAQMQLETFDNLNKKASANEAVQQAEKASDAASQTGNGAEASTVEVRNAEVFGEKSQADANNVEQDNNQGKDGEPEQTGDSAKGDGDGAKTEAGEVAPEQPTEENIVEQQPEQVNPEPKKQPEQGDDGMGGK